MRPTPEPTWPTIVVRTPQVAPSGRRRTSGAGAAPAVDPKLLEGLVDPISMEPLDPAQGLFQCRRCTVYYHAASYELLRAENSGRCASCQGTRFIRIAETRHQQEPAPRGATPVVTLADYRRHVNRVVTFEGTVHRIQRSRRGCDLALMFEPTTWAKGFKLVAFKDSIPRVGGEAFLLGLEGRRIRVRGLIRNGGPFGYAISLTNRAAILEVL